MTTNEIYDVVVVLEKAPIHLRGGNSFFTGGLFRFAYDGIGDIAQLLPDLTDKEKDDIDVGSYGQSEFYSDVMRVTEGLSDPNMLDVLGYPIDYWKYANRMK